MPPITLDTHPMVYTLYLILPTHALKSDHPQKASEDTQVLTC
jgi:hypothetical protein